MIRAETQQKEKCSEDLIPDVFFVVSSRHERHFLTLFLASAVGLHHQLCIVGYIELQGA